jgi:hypothetical protein
VSFYHSEIKEEVGNPFINQISQKDFLFDPLAAAYYERFSVFNPGSELNFNDLKWPALASNR